MKLLNFWKWRFESFYLLDISKVAKSIFKEIGQKYQKRWIPASASWHLFPRYPTVIKNQDTKAFWRSEPDGITLQKIVC